MFKSPLPPFFRPSFRFKILTTDPNETFTLPLLSGTHDFIVKWGDGSSNTITAYDDANRIHNYVTAGTHTISMSGICTSFSCNKLDEPEKFLEIIDITDMGFTTLNFSGASITSIPSNFKILTHLTTAYTMFARCPLTSIPAGIFDGNTGITNFRLVFSEIPVTTLPTDLFKYNTLATTFEMAFYNSALIALPIDLFRYNVAVTNFQNVFSGCSLLTTVPNYLFKYNTENNINFRGALGLCDNLQLNANIFYVAGDVGFDNGEQPTRFLNKYVDIRQCFTINSFFGSTQGVAPDLWNCNFGSGGPTKQQCFSGHTEDSLLNYADIPVDWR